MSKIEVKNLTMQFKNVTALKEVTLTFEENKIYGLLGRNGAGKTTLLNLITNKLFATSGDIFIDGEDCRENDNALSKIYFMTEKNLYPESMKIKDAFKWSKEFYANFDIEYAKMLADKFSLNINKRTKELSTGYSSIFKLIIALSCNAPIILLDEPVLGLDANHRDLFYKELIENYSNNPRTIVVSTHLIEEVAEIIEHVVIIRDGEVIQDKATEDLLSMGYCVSGASDLVDTFVADKEILGLNRIGGLKTACILGKASKKDVPQGLEIARIDLQQLFIHLTNSEGGRK